jgi:hypothetical protein
MRRTFFSCFVSPSAVVIDDIILFCPIYTNSELVSSNQKTCLLKVTYTLHESQYKYTVFC